MAGGGGGGGGAEGPRQLDQTPTWAVSTVCGVIILISIVLELMIHKIGQVKKNENSSTFLRITHSHGLCLRSCSREKRRKHCTKLFKRSKTVPKKSERVLIYFLDLCYKKLGVDFFFFSFSFCRAYGFGIYFSATNVWAKLHHEHMHSGKIRWRNVLLWSVRWSQWSR